jgi:hypothetical protein
MNNPSEVIEDKHEGTLHCYGSAIDPYTKHERFIVIVFTSSLIARLKSLL